jgi:hypothetical protein
METKKPPRDTLARKFYRDCGWRRPNALIRRLADYLEGEHDEQVLSSRLDVRLADIRGEVMSELSRREAREYAREIRDAESYYAEDGE